MYEILKAIAESYNWIFFYGRSDYQNLFKAIEQKTVPHIFLDPVNIKEIQNDSNVIEAIQYSGRFMILFSSNIDEEDYDTRYQNYIKPIIDDKLSVIKDEIRCSEEVSFDVWEYIEIINVFDYNLDGVLVTYSLTIDQ